MMPEDIVKQIQVWEDRIERYKNTYSGIYRGKQPSEKLIASFCEIYHIPWPLPKLSKNTDETEWDFLK